MGSMFWTREQTVRMRIERAMPALSSPASNSPAWSSQTSMPRILVIGAGMSGILLVIKLREAGFTNVRVFEKSDRPGGTWRDNTYPGLKCDVPSHLFTYSFEPHAEYSHRYPFGDEIQRYLMRVYEKYQVGECVEFQRAVDSCNYEDGFWYVQTKDGEIHVFDVVISATGILHTPQYPSIEGMREFEGVQFHTARWNHSIPLEGKRIGVIGTGSTSVQIVPELLKRAGHVTLFQRTPQWIFPMPDKKFSTERREALRTDPSLAQRLRRRYSLLFRWTFARAVIGNRWLLWAIEAVCRNHVRRKVKDPTLRRKLTPSYRAGCKRLIFAKGFYEAVQQPHASLVDSSIERIEAEGVRTVDGTLHPLDVLIYATGYQAHNYMRPIHIRGRAGCTLNDVWSKGAFAHRSTSIPGFPNFFMLFGPHSPIGNFSAISVAEVQCAYVIRQLQTLRDSGNELIEACPEQTRTLHEGMRKAMRRTVWTSGCASWYQDQQGNIPMWPWTFERFVRDLSKVRLEEFRLSRRPQPARTTTLVVESQVLGAESNTAAPAVRSE